MRAPQLHLALAGQDSLGYPNGMTASWQTINQTATSVCKFSTNPSLSGASIATGTQYSYYATFDHHVVMQPLAPATTYYYACGDLASGFSSINSFRTLGGASDPTLRVVQWADMGTDNSAETISRIAQLAPSADLLLWSGDICYADDAFLHDPFVFGYETVWNECMTSIANFTASVPLQVAPGNHEAECHSPACLLDEDRKVKLGNFSAYNSRFRMPSDVSGGALNMWYSFNAGPVHFVIFNSETDFPHAPNDSYRGLPNGGFGDQLTWLENDLAQASAQRSIRPWIVATSHRPLYSVAESDPSGAPQGENADVVAVFEPLFHKYGVDVHFSGHVHSYERSLPVYNRSPVPVWSRPNATVYVVSGAGGSIEGHTSYPPSVSVPWSAYTNGVDYGVGVFDVDAHSFQWQFLRATDGSVLDSFTITK